MPGALGVVPVIVAQLEMALCTVDDAGVIQPTTINIGLWLEAKRSADSGGNEFIDEPCCGSECCLS